MRKFKFEICCDNAAFDPAVPEYEIARIMRETANKIEARGISKAVDVRDINGNTVGQCSITHSPRSA